MYNVAIHVPSNLQKYSIRIRALVLLYAMSAESWHVCESRAKIVALIFLHIHMDAARMEELCRAQSRNPAEFCKNLARDALNIQIIGVAAVRWRQVDRRHL